MSNKIDFKYTKKLISNSLTYKLSLNLNLLLTIFSLLLITLYIIGNYQNFQDMSQQTILSVLSYVSVFNILLSFLLLVETIFKLATEKRKIKSIINIIYLIFAMFLGLLFSGTANIISFISMGV